MYEAIAVVALLLGAVLVFLKARARLAAPGARRSRSGGGGDGLQGGDSRDGGGDGGD